MSEIQWRLIKIKHKRWLVTYVIYDGHNLHHGDAGHSTKIGAIIHAAKLRREYGKGCTATVSRNEP